MIKISLLLLSAATAILSVAGIVVSRDTYAKLIFGSIASGGSLVFLVVAVILEQGLSMVTLQSIVLLVLMVPSSAIATHCIAGLVHDRSKMDRDPNYDEVS